MGERTVKVKIGRAKNRLRIDVKPAVIILGKNDNDTCHWELDGGGSGDTIDIRPKNINAWPVANPRPHGRGNGRADSGAITANPDPNVVYSYEIDIKTAGGRRYLIDPDMIIDEDGSGGVDPDDDDDDEAYDGDGDDEKC